MRQVLKIFLTGYLALVEWWFTYQTACSPFSACDETSAQNPTHLARRLRLGVCRLPTAYY